MTNETKNTGNRLKNLKEGDPVYVRSSFDSSDANGNILTTHYYVLSKGKQIKMHTCSSPENIIIPSELKTPAPKYDPCRIFKKGDKVKLREEVQGRKMSLFVTGLSLGKIYTVEHDECNHTVVVFGDECLGRYSFVHLELVTPVEELEPYNLEQETFYIDDEECGMLHIYYNYNGGRDKVRTFYENGPESWNATKAAAEAECARLNAEYRKEQK